MIVINFTDFMHSVSQTCSPRHRSRSKGSENANDISTSARQPVCFYAQRKAPRVTRFLALSPICYTN
jgi:hypothetical protein